MHIMFLDKHMSLAYHLMHVARKIDWSWHYVLIVGIGLKGENWKRRRQDINSSIGCMVLYSQILKQIFLEILNCYKTFWRRVEENERGNAIY